MNYFKSLSNRFKFVQGLAVGLSASSLLAYAVVTLPYTFTKGTAISAAEVNANFAALKAEVEKMNIGIMGILDGDQSQNCVSSPNYTTNSADFKLLNWKNDTEFFNSYSVTVSGFYEIKFNINSSMPANSTHEVIVENTNGTSTSIGAGVRKLSAGQKIKVFFACMPSATETSYEANSFLIIKKL